MTKSDLRSQSMTKSVVYKQDPTVLEHFRECPAQRSETFEADRPPHGPGSRVRITRCIDCGAQVVVNAPRSEEALA